MTQLRRLAKPELGLDPFRKKGQSFGLGKSKQIDEPATFPPKIHRAHPRHALWIDDTTSSPTNLLISPQCGYGGAPSPPSSTMPPCLLAWSTIINASGG